MTCITELMDNRVAVCDNNIVQIWDLNKTTIYLKEVVHHEDQIAQMLPMDEGEFLLTVGRD